MPDNQDMHDEANRLLSENLPSGMIQAFGGMHEIYQSLRAGGFSEFQALWIIGYVISGGARPKDEA